LFGGRFKDLRWFLGIVLRIPPPSLSRAHERVRVQKVRDFAQTKLDSEINAPLLLNEHGDLYFLFHNFNEDNILNNWERNQQKSMATFLANEINTTERYIGAQHRMSKLFFLERIEECRVVVDIFRGRRWINNQWKSNSVWCNTLHRKILEFIFCARKLLYVTKSHLNNHICQHCGVKISTVTPSFYYVFNISLSCNYSIRSFIGNLWRVLLLGNHPKVNRIMITSSITNGFSCFVLCIWWFLKLETEGAAEEKPDYKVRKLESQFYLFLD